MAALDFPYLGPAGSPCCSLRSAPTASLVYVSVTGHSELLIVFLKNALIPKNTS